MEHEIIGILHVFIRLIQRFVCFEAKQVRQGTAQSSLSVPLWVR